MVYVLTEPFWALQLTYSVFVPGSTVDQTSFKSFLRFALLRLCPESVAGKDATEFSIKDYFRKTLDLSSPVARKNLALLQPTTSRMLATNTSSILVALTMAASLRRTRQDIGSLL